MFRKPLRRTTGWATQALLSPTLLASLLASLLLSVALAPASARAGDHNARIHYLLHCGGCHLADGRGVPPEVPSLRGDIARLAAFPDGRRYLARVPGASQAPITDTQLADVLNWVLVTFSTELLPAGFMPLSAEEVGSARRDVLADPLRERQRIWASYDIGVR